MPMVPNNFSGLITFTRASGATFVGSNGLIQLAATNVPRFDYDPVTLAVKGLLIEEQRTNLLTWSQDFDNAAWSTTGAAITPNAAISPDGSVTADKVISNLGSVNGNVFQLPALAANTVYTESVYCKKAEWNWAILQNRSDVTDNITAWFNLDTGSVGSVDAGGTATITDVGNGWYRCSLTRTTSATPSSTRVRVYPTNANNVVSTGDGTSGIFIWGAQLEQGAFSTSYIPTVASQVTRSADVASVNTLSPWYNAAEGTLFAEVTPYGVLTDTRVASLQGTNNRILIWGASTGSQARYEVITNGSTEVNLSINNTFIANATTKAAAAYKVNDFSFSANGGAAVTDTSGQVSVNITVLNIGGSTGAPLFSGAIRRITYYPRRLSNAELQALTV